MTAQEILDVVWERLGRPAIIGRLFMPKPDKGNYDLTVWFADGEVELFHIVAIENPVDAIVNAIQERLNRD